MNRKFTLGQKKEYGTYNACMMFDPAGNTVCQFYDVPMHCTLEDIEGDKRSMERHGAGLARAKMVVAAVNQAVAKVDLEIDEEKRPRAHRLQIYPFKHNRMHITVDAYAVMGRDKWDKATISLGLIGAVTADETLVLQAAMVRAVELAAQLDKEHGLV